MAFSSFQLECLLPYPCNHIKCNMKDHTNWFRKPIGEFITIIYIQMELSFAYISEPKSYLEPHKVKQGRKGGMSSTTLT